MDFGPKQSGWLINQLGVPRFYFVNILLGLLQHPPVLGQLLLLFCGLRGDDGTGLGEAHGLRLVTAQPLVKMNFEVYFKLELIENLTAVKRNGIQTVRAFLERVSPLLTKQVPNRPPDSRCRVVGDVNCWAYTFNIEVTPSISKLKLQYRTVCKSSIS